MYADAFERCFTTIPIDEAEIVYFLDLIIYIILGLYWTLKLSTNVRTRYRIVLPLFGFLS